MNVNEISVQELKALKDANANFILLDVRNPDEYILNNLGGKSIPLPELPQRLAELDKTHHIVVHCQAGGRSRRATEYLMQQGFTHVSNLLGGLNAWLHEIASNQHHK